MTLSPTSERKAEYNILIEVGTVCKTETISMQRENHEKATLQRVWLCKERQYLQYGEAQSKGVWPRSQHTDRHWKWIMKYYVCTISTPSCKPTESILFPLLYFLHLKVLKFWQLHFTSPFTGPSPNLLSVHSISLILWPWFPVHWEMEAVKRNFRNLPLFFPPIHSCAQNNIHSE